jgi:hypothetical protein
MIVQGDSELEDPFDDGYSDGSADFDTIDLTNDTTILVCASFSIVQTSNSLSGNDTASSKKRKCSLC